MEPQPVMKKLERRLGGIEWELRRVKLGLVVIGAGVAAVGAAMLLAL